MTDLIIFSGQSNMEGQTEKLLDSSTVKGAYEYKLSEDRLVPLCDPFGENLRFDGTLGEDYEDSMGMTWHEKHVFGASAYGNTTLIPEFCRVYIKKTGREVTAVGAAKGAADLDYFMPGSDWYKMLIKKVNGALTKTENFSGNIYIVWLQGESDAIIGKDTDTYIKQIRELAASLASDIALSRFCIIRVGRFTNDERDDDVIEAQSIVCKTDKNFLMLTEEASEMNKIPEYMNSFAGGHFSAAGLTKLGADAAYTLAAYVTKKEL